MPFLSHRHLAQQSTRAVWLLVAGGKHQMRKDATKAPAWWDVSHLVHDELILKISYRKKSFSLGPRKNLVFTQTENLSMNINF